MIVLDNTISVADESGEEEMLWHQILNIII